MVPEPPCTASPIGLFSTITSASSYSVMDLRKARVLSSASLAGRRAALALIELQRRNADRLPGLQPVLGLRALAVHAQLAFADDALDVGERQPGKARLEEAVDPHAGLVRVTTTVCTPVAALLPADEDLLLARRSGHSPMPLQRGGSTATATCRVQHGDDIDIVLRTRYITT